MSTFTLAAWVAQPASAGPLTPVAPGFHPLIGSTTIPCDPKGPTAQDAALALQIAPKMTAKMRGQMYAYRISCARVVLQAVKNRGLPPRAGVIAIATVIVEASLTNPNQEVDHDSLGLFQQRAPWGTRAERLDPETATNKFLDKMLRIDDWMSRPAGAVCQMVQISGYPDRYALQISDAQIIVDLLWSGGSASRGVSDVNGDGRDDIVAISPGPGGKTSITTWMSSGRTLGGGNPATTGSPYKGLRVAIGDLDNDGAADLIIAGPDPKGTQFMASFGVKGSAYFSGFVPIGKTAGNPQRIHAGDVDGDGRDDIIGLSPAPGGKTGITTWMSKGRTLGGGNPGVTGTPYAGLRLAVGDLDNDGSVDLIIAGPDPKGTKFMASFGIKGGVAFSGFVLAGKTAGNPQRIHAGDVDGDGRDDIIGLSPAPGGKTGITTWMSKGRTLGGGNPGMTASPYASLRLTIADLDNDGSVDLVVAGPDPKGTQFMASFGIKGGVAFSGFVPAGKTAGNPAFLLTR